jgi:type IV secretion system protein VirB4
MGVIASDYALERTVRKSTVPFSEFAKYVAHLDDNIIHCAAGSIFRMWEIGGVSFHTTDLSQLQKQMDDWSRLQSSNARLGRTFYVWMVRERITPKLQTQGFVTDFAKNLAADYQRRLNQMELYANRWFLGVEDKIESPLNAVTGLFFKSTNQQAISASREKAKADLNQLGIQLESTLGEFSVKPMGLYEDAGTVFSMPLEFINFLISGAWRKTSLGYTELRNLVGLGRLFTNADIQESQVNGRSIFSTQLGVKEYSGLDTYPGILNSFLEVPYEVVLAQSWSCIPDQASIKMLTTQRDRLTATTEGSEILVNQLKDAIAQITARELTYGEHSLQIKVLANDLDTLNLNCASSITVGQRAGISLERENPTSLAGHFSMLPGNLRFRPRPAPISQLNFAAFSSFHNFPVGQAKNNKWGDALFPVATTANTVHYFNLHSGAVGNFFITGKTRQGKTVLLGLILSMSERAGARFMVVDRKRGMELVVRGLHGSYTKLTPAENTGINPFDRNNDEKSIAFIIRLMTFCAESTGSPLTMRQKDTLVNAIRDVMMLDIETRGIDALLSSLPDRDDDNGIFKRLQPWASEGEYHWVFKHAGRGIDYYSTRIFGVDLSEIVRLDVEKQVVAYELFDRYRQMLEVPGAKGFIGDEWQQLLTSPFWAKEIDDLERLSSSYNGLIGGASQEGEDLSASAAMRTVITQAASKIFLPMSDLKKETFTRDIGVTEQQFQVIKDMPLGSRQFTLLQDEVGVVCTFDLSGMPQIPVFSTTPELLLLAERLMEKHGNNPDVWLPIYMQEAPFVKAIRNESPV